MTGNILLEDGLPELAALGQCFTPGNLPVGKMEHVLVFERAGPRKLTSPL